MNGVYFLGFELMAHLDKIGESMILVGIRSSPGEAPVPFFIGHKGSMWFSSQSLYESFMAARPHNFVDVPLAVQGWSHLLHEIQKLEARGCTHVCADPDPRGWGGIPLRIVKDYVNCRLTGEDVRRFGSWIELEPLGNYP